MNPLCPSCQTELTDDFGLVDCKSCGAVCSIDLEDNVTVQGDEPLDEAAEEHIALVADSGYNLEQEEEQEQSFEVEHEEVESAETDDLTETQAEDVQEYEEPSVAENAVAAAAVPPVSSLSGEDFLKDLEVFSEDSAPAGGHIYYDFHVAGLESHSVREIFIETLADSRLEISEESIRETLGDSDEFTLLQISFLRLTVIHKRLLTLGVDMSWSLSEVQEPISYMMGELVEEDVYTDSGEDEEYEAVEEEI